MSEDGQVVDHQPPSAWSCDEPSQSGLVPDRRQSARECERSAFQTYSSVRIFSNRDADAGVESDYQKPAPLPVSLMLRRPPASDESAVPRECAPSTLLQANRQYLRKY